MRNKGRWGSGFHGKRVLGLCVALKVEWRVTVEFDGRDIRKIRDWMEIVVQTMNEHEMNG